MKPCKSLYFDESGATLFREGRLHRGYHRLTPSTQRRLTRLCEAAMRQYGALRAGVSHTIRDYCIRRREAVGAEWWE